MRSKFSKFLEKRLETEGDENIQQSEPQSELERVDQNSSLNNSLNNSEEKIDLSVMESASSSGKSNKGGQEDEDKPPSSKKSKILIEEEQHDISKSESNNSNQSNLSESKESSHDIGIQSNFNFMDPKAELINRSNIENHRVGIVNQQNIRDFLGFKVRPRATNLTIGLKKMISVARAFLEEPDFLVLEENSLDFDELDNHFFIDVLKVRIFTSHFLLIFCRA